MPLQANWIAGVRSLPAADSAQIRAWQATYAGTDAGNVVITLEFADFAAFARSEPAYTQAASDPEFSTWAAGLAVIRTITSDSLHIELAPAGASPE